MDELITARGILKGKLTRFRTFLDKLRNTDADANQELAIDQIEELEVRLTVANGLLSEFDEIQYKIDQKSAEGGAVDPDARECRQTFETSYFSSISLSKTLIDKYQVRSTSPTNSVRSGGSKTPTNSVRSGGSKTPTGSVHSRRTSLSPNDSSAPFIKLPTISLPKFNGDVSQWLEFREIFKNLIHENDSVKDVQKLHYLKASLTGQASEVIKSLEFTAANYKVAWDSICARYNNPRMLVHNHLKAICDLEPLTKESAQKLRKINDALFKHLTALKSLATEEALLETFIIFLVTKKLDTKTAREWESSKKNSNKDLPTLEEFKGFLKETADLLETLEAKQEKPIPEKTKQHSKSFISNSISCLLCKKPHPLSRCDTFLKLSPHERSCKVKELKVCYNCLSKIHFLLQCNSAYTCRKCQAKHHTLLHEDALATSSNSPGTAISADTPGEPSRTTSAFCSNAVQTLLPIASAQALDSTGNPHSVRILLDSGSQSNFITKGLCRKLNLQTHSTNVFVSGLSKATSHINSRCNVALSAHHTPFVMTASCLVINQISGVMPGFRVNRTNLKIPDNIKLSDPSFDTPKEIDILLGSPVFWELLCIGQVSLGPNLPILQKTRFGWVVAGPTSASLVGQIQCNFSCLEDTPNLLTRFWELEQYPTEKVLSQEENECEAHFVQTTRRDPEGRFIVSVPFKTSLTVLGDSLQTAQKRFLALERKFLSDPALAERYSAFMQEYENLGHMTVTNPTQSEISYYLPHHGVVKEESLTTKLRVVFNGSAVTSTGHSLNSIQMVGPTIQQDLFSILIRFRKHFYAIAADIEKMYRQVRVEPSRRPLQRILWRSSRSDPIQTYNLNTVTYGTASASFLAIRCLTQMGIECEHSLPEVSKTIKEDFYVDDLLTGADNLDQARHLCTNLLKVLDAGCFKLRKFISNDPAVLSNVHQSDIHPGVLELGTHEHASTLGLIWHFSTDHLMYSISNASRGRMTKRIILSEISQIFDPLGLLAPCTIYAKIILQQLWLEKLSWDDQVPCSIQDKWSSYRSEFTLFNDLKIPRYVLCKEHTEVELHGFCDASNNAYGACIYLRSRDHSNQVQVSILCAKSKVAPLKPITIPKLELCGAVLLTKLSDQVLKAINLTINRCVLWTDSTIVLGWLKTSPNLLKTFVCNRVAEIQRLTSHATWLHVPTKLNPADLVSRGVPPRLLKESSIWWSGPTFLLKDEDSWPTSNATNPSLPELKKEAQCLSLSVSATQFPFKDFSNIARLERILAYCKRFRSNCFKPKAERVIGPLNPNEIQEALESLVKLSQAESYPEELKQLGKREPVGNSSSLKRLNPFLDLNGIIRVGGRLQNSQLSYSRKFPMVISGKHHLTKLIVSREHVRLLHAGPQLLLSTLRKRFWIISARNLAKQVVHQCLRCYRFSTKITEPIMGNLPQSRVEPSAPFHITGVDYAGPIIIKDRKGRGSKHSKAYICLFICFSTKAAHIELVTDLTTECFIMALRRFIGRRGKPAHIYSDNGTNFIGANSELRELGTALKEQNATITQSAADEGISWHFVPARSPHFGGLWEAGVKSVKHHLKRVTGNAFLTYEELCTLLIQVEAILNSRPLSPLSSDPSDLEPLTPAHFLVGRPLVSAPDPNLQEITDSRLSTYQRVQKLQQHMWSRWSKEYLAELQQRSKWYSNRSDLRKNSMVLIKEDNLTPLQWRLGRIVQVHPGKDGINRVASIRTANGIIRRSFAKICPLPLEESASEVNK